MCSITNSTKHNKKYKKVDLRNLISKYDVIYDGIEVIFYKNVQNLHYFGDMGTGRNLAKNRAIA
jgi:hypothetical protein